MLSSPCMGLHFKVLLLAFCDDVSLACLHFHYFISRKFTEIDFFFLNFHLLPPPHRHTQTELLLLAAEWKISKEWNANVAAHSMAREGKITGRGSSHCSTSLAAYHSHFSNFLWLVCHLDVIYIFCNHIVCMHGENDSYFLYATPTASITAHCFGFGTVRWH